MHAANENLTLKSKFCIQKKKKSKIQGSKRTGADSVLGDSSLPDSSEDKYFKKWIDI